MGPAVAAAARALRRGGLVVAPTDTVFGLFARASDRSAVGRLTRAKGRSGHQPLAIVVSSTEEIETWARLSLPARAWLRRRLPGPFTALLAPSRAARRALERSVAGHPALGVRVPDHPLVRELARRVGPLAATSANLHGRPPYRTLGAARRGFGPVVGVYVPGGPRPRGTASTLVDVRGPRPRTVERR